MKKRWILALLLALCVLLSSCALVGPQTVEEPTEQPAQTQSNFEVYFLDVGQADSALIACDGEYMLIDGGNVDDGSYVVSILKKLGVDSLEYVINTHPDEDHCGGLAGVLAKFPAEHVMSSVHEHDTKAFSNFVKYANERNCEIEVPQAADEFMFGSAQVQILGPLRDYEDTNENSIVLKIVYGETSFLFTGDIGLEAEDELAETWPDLSATVLKVAHHGSAHSSGYVFLRAVMPQYGVISVGADNSYGHPTEQALSRLDDADVVVLRTDELGMICAISDGNTVQFSSEKAGEFSQKLQMDLQQTEEEKQYIGNVKSQILHDPDCGNLPTQKNQILFDSIEQAMQNGYRTHSCIQ